MCLKQSPLVSGLNVFRMLALHAASSYPGAQLYVRLISIGFIAQFSHKCRRWNVLSSKSAVEEVLLQRQLVSQELTRVSVVVSHCHFSDCWVRLAGSDPGITINIYQTLKSYTIPGAVFFWQMYIPDSHPLAAGPAVFSCDDSSSPSTSVVPSSVPATSVPSSSAASTSAPIPSQTGATAAHYAQCGGVG